MAGTTRTGVALPPPSPVSGALAPELEADGSAARHLLIALPLSAVFTFGLLLDSEALLTVTALAAIGAAVALPPVGLLTLVIMSPLLAEHPILPAPGFSFLLVAGTLLGCVYRLPLDRPRLVAPPALLLLAAYVLYAFVQQAPDMLAGYPTEDLRDVGSITFKLLTGLGAIVAAGFVLRGRSPYPFLAAGLGSAAVVAALGIIPTLAPELGAQLVNLLAEPEQSVRQGGPIGNPNYFGNFLAISAVLALGWLIIATELKVRLALALPLLLALAGLAVSQSRGALVTLTAGLIAMAFVRGRRAGLVVSAAAAAMAAAAIPFVLTNRVLQQAGMDVMASFQSQALSDAGRLQAILTGPELFLTSPIFGVGVYRYVLEGGTYSHNWYMTVLAEQGIVGTLLWLGMLLAVTRWLLRRPLGPRTVGMGVFGTIVIGSMFLEPPWDEHTFVLPAIAMVAALVADWGRTRNDSVNPAPALEGLPPLRLSGSA